MARRSLIPAVAYLAWKENDAISVPLLKKRYGVSHATAYRIIRLLKLLDLLEETHLSKNTKIYKLKKTIKEKVIENGKEVEVEKPIKLSLADFERVFNEHKHEFA